MAQAMQGAAYLNGEFVPASEANVSIFDSGFIGGVSVFDTLACWQGGLFKLPQHRARFERLGARGHDPLGCQRNWSWSRSSSRPPAAPGVARPTCRPSPRAVAAPHHRCPRTSRRCIVYAIPYVSLWPEDKAESGISVMIPLDPAVAGLHAGRQNQELQPHAHALARLEAERAGSDDVVLLDDRGLLTESRGSNLFVVRGDALYTPRSGILEGITRQTVFEIACGAGHPGR